jgi:hypothetical protein
MITASCVTTSSRSSSPPCKVLKNGPDPAGYVGQLYPPGGRTVVELPEPGPPLGLLGEPGFDPTW